MLSIKIKVRSKHISIKCHYRRVRISEKSIPKSPENKAKSKSRSNYKKMENHTPKNLTINLIQNTFKNDIHVVAYNTNSVECPLKVYEKSATRHRVNNSKIQEDKSLESTIRDVLTSAKRCKRYIHQRDYNQRPVNTNGNNQNGYKSKDKSDLRFKINNETKNYHLAHSPQVENNPKQEIRKVKKRARSAGIKEINPCCVLSYYFKNTLRLAMKKKESERAKSRLRRSPINNDPKSDQKSSFIEPEEVSNLTKVQALQFKKHILE